MIITKIGTTSELHKRLLERRAEHLAKAGAMTRVDEHGSLSAAFATLMAYVCELSALNDAINELEDMMSPEPAEPVLPKEQPPVL